MGNIISYLKWRGDLTFAERPFCEVDNLVLSELAYLEPGRYSAHQGTRRLSHTDPGSSPLLPPEAKKCLRRWAGGGIFFFDGSV